jgi:hypothetical protein
VGAKPARHLAEIAEGYLRALHVLHVRSGRSPPEPLDESIHRRGLADCEHLDATVSKIANVTAATELLRALASGRTIENALDAPGHVAAPCDVRRQRSQPVLLPGCAAPRASAALSRAAMALRRASR